jgi:hypothetical protein
MEWAESIQTAIRQNKKFSHAAANDNPEVAGRCKVQGASKRGTQWNKFRKFHVMEGLRHASFLSMQLSNENRFLKFLGATQRMHQRFRFLRTQAGMIASCIK